MGWREETGIFLFMFLACVCVCGFVVVCFCYFVQINLTLGLTCMSVHQRGLYFWGLKCSHLSKAQAPVQHYKNSDSKSNPTLPRDPELHAEACSSTGSCRLQGSRYIKASLETESRSGCPQRQNLCVNTWKLSLHWSWYLRYYQNS